MNERRALVSSPDGTEIACWVTGGGAPMVLVHGATADHARWTPLLPFLEPRYTVFAMDRRGRGGSGDAPTYDIETEYADVAAVVDAAAQECGSPVVLYGHSYGGLCSFGAAALTENLRAMILYEGWPPVDVAKWESPEGLEDRMEKLVEEGHREEALETLMRDVVQMPPEEMAAVKAQPSWSNRVAAVHTVPRELRAMVGVTLDPGRAASIHMPVMLMVGSESPDPAASEVDIVAETLPDARIEVLGGQQHVADVLAPLDFASRMLSFLGEQG